MARIITKESPSMINGEHQADAAGLNAKRAAWASPRSTSIEGSLRELTRRKVTFVVSKSDSRHSKGMSDYNIKVDF